MVEKLNNVIDVVYKLSDLAFQKDVWVDSKYWDRVLDLGEAINTLDDYFFFDEVEQGTLNIDETSLMIIRKFCEDVLKFEWNCDANSMLNDLNWIYITKQAALVCEILKNECLK